MKRLYRSRQDNLIAGICGGMGDYFGIDPVFFRLIFALLLLPGGFPGFIPYVILWFIVPKSPKL